ncbi:MAG: 2-phospho-L-lactate transferase [Alphaproteobacteria bacterium]|nr:2-phospho-L-lactate transferase [Alphaproteobacteria bacterium]
MIECVALSGGVGGAKLALGLSKAMDPASLLIVANTGDDFDHLGLRICPDIDTVSYTLGDLANPELGWGRRDESWSFMETLKTLGGEAWFNLGDRDLALHVERTRRLQAGNTLSVVTTDMAARFGIASTIVPMSDDDVRTIVDTPGGPLAFQHYFVRERCEPKVTGFRFAGASDARPSPAFRGAFEGRDPAMVIICPSNPFISIDPILAVSGVRRMLEASRAPVIAISPIVGGKAIKGPTAKMMDELGMPATALEVAKHYTGLIDGFVLDEADREVAGAVRDLGLGVLVTNTVMKSLDDRVSLAREVIAFSQQVSEK